MLPSLGNGVTHVGVPGDGSIYFFLGEEHSGFNAILGMDGVLEDFIFLVSAQARGLHAVPEKEVRRRVRRKGHSLAGKVFNAVDALIADRAIGAAGPIGHQDAVPAKALLLELAVILGVNVERA